ncbi:hypothetical protein [Moraxella lacunata]
MSNSTTFVVFLSFYLMNLSKQSLNNPTYFVGSYQQFCYNQIKKSC